MKKRKRKVAMRKKVKGKGSRKQKRSGKRTAARRSHPKARRMGKRELREYKKLLLEEKERIAGEIQHIAHDTLNKSQKEASGDISGYTYHMADVATDSYDREFSLGIASSEREILYDINEALKRIEDNVYGNCLECAKPVTKKRLKAVPHTKYCIKCQSTIEMKEKRA